MKKIKKIVGMAGLMLGLALLGSAAAEAQTFPLSNQPYHCHWQRLDTSGNVIQKGVSLATFQNLVWTDSITQQGTLFTVYANATSVSKAVTVQMHPVNGGIYFYQPQDGISCALNVSPNASTVEWFSCSNRVRQWCYQP